MFWFVLGAGCVWFAVAVGLIMVGIARGEMG